MVLVPEGRQIFVGDDRARKPAARAPICGATATSPADIEALYTRFPNLGRRRDNPAAVLSGGEQQMLAIGRALLAPTPAHDAG